MYWFVVESPVRKSLAAKGSLHLISKGILDMGWGNGYVIIPPEHRLHGKKYEHILLFNTPVELTFAADAKYLDWLEIPEEEKNGWVIGFDTAHYGDTMEKWPKHMVEKMTIELMRELMRDKDYVKAKYPLLF